MMCNEVRREQLGTKVKKLDLNEVLDVAGTPIILVSHLNTLLEILCPCFNNPLTSLISFHLFSPAFLFLHGIHSDIQSPVPSLLLQAHHNHMSFQGIKLVTI